MGKNAARLLLVLVAALGLIAAACSDDSDDVSTSEDTTDDSTAAASESGTTDTSAEPAGDVVVALGDTDLGQVLVDADGRTLYVFDNDSDGVSACNEGCVDTWPPLTVDADTVAVGEGLDGAQFTVITRDDGSSQAAVDGRPLYLFSGDSAAGDTNGQAVGDIWWVVGADGAAITGDAAEETPPAGEDPTTTAADGGY